MKKILNICLLAILVSCQTVPSYNSTNIGLGKDPQLPEPSISFIPTVNIARASSWPEGIKPQVKDGFIITEYSRELTHPRWLYVLPNGDILVAQSNKQPPKKIKGLKDLVAGYIMKRAGAGVVLDESAREHARRHRESRPCAGRANQRANHAWADCFRAASAITSRGGESARRDRRARRASAISATSARHRRLHHVRERAAQSTFVRQVGSANQDSR